MCPMHECTYRHVVHAWACVYMCAWRPRYVCRVHIYTHVHEFERVHTSAGMSDTRKFLHILVPAWVLLTLCMTLCVCVAMVGVDT